MLAKVSSHCCEYPRPVFSYSSGSSIINNSLGKSFQIPTGVTSGTDTHLLSLPLTPQLNDACCLLEATGTGQTKKALNRLLHTFQNPLTSAFVFRLKKKILALLSESLKY